jgi:hypothetical protein
LIDRTGNHSLGLAGGAGQLNQVKFRRSWDGPSEAEGPLWILRQNALCDRAFSKAPRSAGLCRVIFQALLQRSAG